MLGGIDLHLHLDGSVTAEDAIFLAERSSIELPKHSAEVLRGYLTAPKRCADLKEYLERFEIPLKLLERPENVAYATRSLVKRLAASGMRYAEIRFAPGLLTAGGASQREVAVTACQAFVAAKEEFGLEGGLIFCAMRAGALTPQENEETARLSAEFLGKGVVGIDLAGDEAKDFPSDHARVFAVAREAGVPITIHAGEAGGADKIRDAIALGARRIGHGVRCVEDESLVAELKEKGIALETCYTSNLNTGACTERTFPLRALMRRGVRVTLNTDNMTVSDTDLATEYASLGITDEEKRILLENAKKAAFAAVGSL